MEKISDMPKGKVRIPADDLQGVRVAPGTNFQATSLSSERRQTFMIIGVVVVLLLAAAFWVGVGYVAFHFIAKFW